MVFNVLLMMYPSNLSYDWQMGSIPLITSFLDARNIMTILVILSLIVLFLESIGTSKTPFSLLKKLVQGRGKKESFRSRVRSDLLLDNNNQETEQKGEDDDEVRMKKNNFSPSSVRLLFSYVYPYFYDRSSIMESSFFLQFVVTLSILFSTQ